MKSRLTLAFIIGAGLLGTGCGVQIARHEVRPLNSGNQLQAEAQEEQPQSEGLHPSLAGGPLTVDEAPIDTSVSVAGVDRILRRAEVDLEQQIIAESASVSAVRVECRAF